jgi:dihydroflavonol-4-reductase
MIAVTGANGLLGSYVVRELLAAQLPFVAIKRKGSNTSLLQDVSSSIVWREADVTEYERVVESLDGVTGVIHTAALVSYHKRDRDTVHAINEGGTRNVVNACLQLNVKRMLHVSSVAALGKSKDKQDVSEESKWIEGARASTYAVSKYRAELEVWRAQEEGLSTVIVNPSVILAPTDWNKSSAQLFKYAWQQRPFYTDGGISVVDVRDVANIIVQLYQSPMERERFILAAGSVSYHDFFAMAARHFHTRAPYIRVGKSLLQTVAALEAVRSFITGATPLVTAETAQLAGKTFTYSNEKVKKALGVDFQSIEKTMAWCCAEYTKKLADKK